LIHKVSKDVKNYRLDDICLVLEAFNRLLKPVDESYLRVKARALRESNIKRLTLDQALVVAGST
jgi:LPS O-antigen subunit length determinant protein (WzzB/FepE family)